jgi:hypothetical protein
MIFMPGYSTRPWRWTIAWIALLSIGSAVRSQPPRFEKDVTEFVARHCVNCHSGKKAKGDVSLDAARSEADLIKDRKLWLNVLRQIVEGAMPPPERPRPSAAESGAFAAALRDMFRRADAGKPRDPGRVVLRRLNRVEYNNTIRDLCRIEFEPASDFPEDDVGFGFDNIGEILTLSPLLMERYLDAAEAIVERAIVADKKPEPIVRLGTAQFTSATGGSGDPKSVFLPTSEPLEFHFTVAAEGRYLLRFAAESVLPGDDPIRLKLTFDGQPWKTLTLVEVPSTPGKPPPNVEWEISLTRGRHSFQATLLNPSREFEDNRLLVAPTFGTKMGEKKRRGARVTQFDLVGPVDPLPEGHRWIMACNPKATPSEQAQEIFLRFAGRAFRRPVEPGEVKRYVVLFDAARQTGDRFERAVQVGLQAILVSPHFLYRVELDDRPQGPGARPISEYQLASRLSYFLWNSMPDDELFDLASKGRLSKSIDAQVRRMLADPKSSSFLESFVTQWLGIRDLERLVRSKEYSFPLLLRADMIRETVLFFDAIVREDRPIEELIDARFTYLNARLANHYRISDVNGQQSKKSLEPGSNAIPLHRYVRVSLPEGSIRGGILTQASVLTATSNPDRTSPVKRGVFVLDQILGSPPPPPPANVPELEETRKESRALNLREAMELHRKKSECAACHARMDPIGFAFERFDVVGQYREQETIGAKKVPIDVSAKLPDGRVVDGISSLKRILLEKKDPFARVMAERLLTYALGRSLHDNDASALDQIVAEAARDGYRMQSLIAAVARSEPFLLRRGKEGVSK